MAKRIVLVLAALLAAPGVARADLPTGFYEPDEDQAKQIATEWRAAVQAGNVDALTELGAFGLMGWKVSHIQITSPDDPKARKKCRKVTTVTTEKAFKKTLPCLLSPEIQAALATANMDSEYSFSATFADIMFGSPEQDMAARAIKKLERDHVFWSFMDMKVDGVKHGLVLAISSEQASGTNRVAAVIHWTKR